MTATAYSTSGDAAAAARRREGLVLALVTAFISGVAVFVNGYGVRRFPDATLYTTAKNVVTAFVLLGVAALAQARRRRASVDRHGDRPTRRSLGGLILVATIGGSVPFVLFFEGLSRASSTDAAVIHKTLVVWVALLAIPLLGERLSTIHVGAIALLVAGQAALAGGLPVLASDAGEAMILAATLLWAGETILAKKLLGSFAPSTVGLARMGLGSVALVAWTVATGKLSLLADVGAVGWMFAALTGMLLAGYVACWFAALCRAPAIDVTALLVVGAVVTTVLNAVFEGAPLAPDAVGVALIAAGGLLVVLATRRRVGTEVAA